MKPSQLWLGDCLEILSKFPSNCFDALVTDPPFGIGFLYGKKKEENSTPQKYWNWLKPRYQEALRCVKPGGFIAVFQAAPYFRYYWDWFGDEIHIYASCKNFVQIRKTPINYSFDPVVMFYKKGGSPLIPKNPKRSVDFYVSNTAIFDKERPEKQHPCPRPLSVMKEIVDNFTKEGGIILDPFMGSGTTGVAALLVGRKFVGVEKDGTYFKIAKERIGVTEKTGFVMQSRGKNGFFK